MTFRRRIVLLAAAAVAVAIALAAGVTYVVVRHNLRAGVDASLRNLPPKVLFVRTSDKQTADAKGGVSVMSRQAPTPGDATFEVQVPKAAFGGASGFVQATLPTGDVLVGPGGYRLPVSSAVREVGEGKRSGFFSDETVRGVHLRVFTTRTADGVALQVVKPLTDVDDTLHRLRWVLVAVTIGGVGLASGFGVAVSRAAARPLGALTVAAERVTATGDLDHRIDGEGDDEPGRLATSFNAMLGALSASRDAQRQLVADASHELRTPLTAIRANIELLERARDLPPPERAEILAAVRGQLEDLTILVGDLVDLARPGEAPGDAPEELRLDELVADAVARARRHAPDARFEVRAEPCVVRGSRARLARAVGNLLDNAVKWSPPGEPIEVAVNGGEVRVRDHGSGLGLAIVKQVADTHGGSVSAGDAPGGGACLRLALPVSALSQTS
jgi:two-component system sensor histidine kinase MprB